MPILLSGNDPRYPALAEMLRESGVQTKMLKTSDDARDAEALIARYPFDERTEAVLTELPPGAQLILLAAKPVPEEIKARFHVISLMDDLIFVNENAILTAEGALAAAMRDAPFALNSENVLVVGYGRIGRALTEMLVALHARVTVVSRRESGRLAAMSRGAQAASLEGMKTVLPDARVVFITSPERILTRNELVYASRGAFLYDLSSAPYGLDLDAAKELGLGAAREGSLPGRYCPESAARAMYRAILRIWNGGDRK